MVPLARLLRPVMRPVCVLCRLGTKEMAWFGSTVLTRARVRIWHGLCLLWRCLTRFCFRALGLVVRPALPDRKEQEGRNSEKGYGDSDTRSDVEDVKEVDEVEEVDGVEEVEEEEEEVVVVEEEEVVAASHNGAAGVKRAAALHWDEVCERPEHEEDEEHGGVDTSDEFYCDYDSTWEDESEPRPSRRSRPPGSSRSYNFRNFERAAKDMQNFRHKYLNQGRARYWRSNKRDDMPNLKFYLGEAASQPDNIFISDFHTQWTGQYDQLERVHTFIQWLFPLQEPGMNYQACPLTPEEVEEFRESKVAKDNLLNSYKLMLDFYGIELCNLETGEVKRARNWRDRFNNLNRHTHNNLRITRILKCLGILGFEDYQVPLVRFFLEETLIRGELPRVKESVLSYFLFAVLDRRERRKLIKFAFCNYDHRDEFVWCPKKIQTTWLQKQTNVGGARDSSPSPDPMSQNTEVPDDADEDDTESL